MKQGSRALGENSEPFHCICIRLNWSDFFQIPLQQKANFLFSPAIKLLKCHLLTVNILGGKKVL